MDCLTTEIKNDYKDIEEFFTNPRVDGDFHY